MFVLAAVESSLEQYESALEPLTRALDLARALDDPRREADVRWMRGWAYAGIGEWRRAVDDLARAIPLFRTLDDPAREARALCQLSEVYVQMGDRERAQEYASTALRAARPLGDSRELAEALHALGSINLWLGRPEQATPLLEEGLAIGERNGYLDSQAHTLESLGVALRMLGRYEEAREPLQRALEMARARHSRYSESETLLQLSGTYNAPADPTRRDLLERALAASRESMNDFIESAALTNLAHFHLVGGELGEARRLVEQAVAVRERKWQRAPNEGLQALYLADQFLTYEIYLDVLLASHRDGDPDALALAFSAVEGARARALRQELARAQLEVQGEVPADLLRRRRQLGRELIEERGAGRIARHIERPTEARPTIDAIEAEIRLVEDEIARTSPRWAALELPDSVNVEDVQRDLLDPDTVLLEYWLGRDRSHLFVVDSTTVEAIELPRRATIEGAAGTMSEAVTARNQRIRFESDAERRERVAAADAGFARAARALSDLVLAPVAGRLAGKRLAIVADGALHYVPFAALPEPRAASEHADPAGARAESSLPLGLAHEIVYLPSVTALRDIRRQSRGRPPQPATLAVLADPVLRSDDPRLPRRRRLGHLLASFGGDDLRGTTPSSARTPTWPDLPHAREEAEAIIELVPASQRLGAMGFAASRAAAARPELSRFRFVHFATHAQLDSDQPDRSGIVLSQFDAEGRPQDGLLSLFDIYGLRLPADLVVLSGCRTALGKELRGEGLIGLTRGFMFAGAPRVVVSLWDVQDRATAELMKKFYSRMLLQGSPPAAALRAAQTDLAASTEWSAPYHWAGFVLVGDWR
jgi:CHAT domain-containing protein